MLWEDFSEMCPEKVTGNGFFTVVGFKEGYLGFYTAAGRKLIPEAFIGKVVDLQSNSQALALALTETGQITCWNLFRQSLLYRTDIPSLAVIPPYSLYLEEQGSLTLNFADNRKFSYSPSTNEWKEVTEKPISTAVSFEQLWEALPCELPITATSPDRSVADIEHLMGCLLQQELIAEYTHLLPDYIQRLHKANDLHRLNALIVHLNRSNCLSKAVSGAVAPLLSGLKQSLRPVLSSL